jgi:hypothetical protein
MAVMTVIFTAMRKDYGVIIQEFVDSDDCIVITEVRPSFFIPEGLGDEDDGIV